MHHDRVRVEEKNQASLVSPPPIDLAALEAPSKPL